MSDTRFFGDDWSEKKYGSPLVAIALSVIVLLLLHMYM